MDKKLPVSTAGPVAAEYRFVDLFSGVGGFTLGFMDETTYPRCRFLPRLLVDIDGAARRVFARNMPTVPFLEADIHNVSASEIRERAALRHDDRLDVLMGGPPCQGFSFLGKRVIDDPRNVHVMDFLRLVKELKPLVAVMENVPLLITSHNGAIIKEVFDGLATLGYASCADVLAANEYGVPQIRKRAFVLAYHRDLRIAPSLPPRTHERIVSAKKLGSIAGSPRFEQDKLPFVSVQEAVGDLPILAAGDGEEVVFYPPGITLSQYQQWSRKDSPAVFNHVSRTHSPSFLRKISVICEGGRNMDLPDGERFSDNYYSQAYARLHRDGIANTITTSFGNPGSGRFLHYRELRSLTVREGARLQSFPDRYVFGEDLCAQMRHVGNAVPPLLARALRDQIGRDLAVARVQAHTHNRHPEHAQRKAESKQTRSRIMRAVPSRNTSAEMSLRKALWAAGLRGFRTHSKLIPGSPDIVFAGFRLAVFVDGCFWHGCPKCYREPATNKKYWQMKVERNKSRAEDVNQACKRDGWQVVRVWEHEITRSAESVAARISKVIVRLRGAVKRIAESEGRRVAKRTGSVGRKRPQRRQDQRALA